MTTLIVIATLVLFSAAVTIYDISKNRINSGKKFVFKKDNFKAVVIVDDSIPVKDDKFFSGGYSKSTGEDLARACYLAMKSVVNILKRNHRLIEENGPWSISPCWFIFLSTSKFNKLVKENGYEDPEMVNVLSTTLERKYFFGIFTSEIPVIFLKPNNMKSIVKRGGIILHELVHVASLLNYKHWDKNHSMWNSIDYKRRRRSLDKILAMEWENLFKREYK